MPALPAAARRPVWWCAYVRPPLVKLSRAEIGRIREALVEAGMLGKAAGRDAA
jgi:hypothetical protein